MDAARGANDSSRPAGSGHADGPPRAWAQFAFFFLFFLLWDALWWTPIIVVSAGAVPGGLWTMIGAAAAGLIPFAFLVTSFATGTAPTAFARVFLVRPFWYIQLFLPAVSLVTVVGGLAGWPVVGFVAAGRASLLGALTLVFVASLIGYWGANRTVLRRLEVGFPHLPAGLDGLRIAQLSDLHVGPQTRKRPIRRIRAAVALGEPDLVVLTGDQIDDHAPDVAALLPVVAGWNPRHGVVAVAGNHDVYANWPAVRQGMEAGGIRVLVNEAVRLEHGGSSFWLAGTGDPAGAGRSASGAPGPAPDLEATMASIARNEFSVVLAHNPALWPGLAALGARLTLSGHTHHGQISIPRWNWCLASPFLEFAMGHYVRDDALLYINPGTNYWGIPFRFGAWPEVTLVTLRRSGGDWASPSVLSNTVERIRTPPRSKSTTQS